MKPTEIVMPPLECECGCDRWFRIKKTKLKSERLYACQDCGKEVKGIVESIAKM